MSYAVSGPAVFSADGLYRYSLHRSLSPLSPKERVVFVLLNPSTADESHNDPTVTRCVDFALRWGCRSLDVVNLFAFRATDPAEMKRYGFPVGPLNDAAILNLCTPSVDNEPLVVCAWGNHGSYLGRASDVCKLLTCAGVKLHYLAVTQEGQPQHPLYLPKITEPVPWL